MEKPLLTRRIYLEHTHRRRAVRGRLKLRRGAVVMLYVFRDAEHARQHRADWPDWMGGLFLPAGSPRVSRRSQQLIGVIGLLAVKGVGPDVISHEATHAALRWMRLTGSGPDLCRPRYRHRMRPGGLMSNQDAEERFCYAVSDLTGQMVRALRTARKRLPSSSPPSP